MSIVSDAAVRWSDGRRAGHVSAPFGRRSLATAGGGVCGGGVCGRGVVSRARSEHRVPAATGRPGRRGHSQGRVTVGGGKEGGREREREGRDRREGE